MGLEKPMRGEVILGEHNVLPNYIEQNQVCSIMKKGLNRGIRIMGFTHFLTIGRGSRFG